MKRKYYFKGNGYDCKGTVYEYNYDYNSNPGNYIDSDYIIFFLRDKQKTKTVNGIIYYYCRVGKYNGENLSYDFSDNKTRFIGTATKIYPSDSTVEVKNINDIYGFYSDGGYGGYVTESYLNTIAYLDLDSIDSNIKIFDSVNDMISYYKNVEIPYIFVNDMSLDCKDGLDSFNDKINNEQYSVAVDGLASSGITKYMGASDFNKLIDNIIKLEDSASIYKPYTDTYYSVLEPNAYYIKGDIRYWVLPLGKDVIHFVRYYQDSGSSYIDVYDFEIEDENGIYHLEEEDAGSNNMNGDNEAYYHLVYLDNGILVEETNPIKCHYSHKNAYGSVLLEDDREVSINTYKYAKQYTKTNMEVFSYANDEI